MIANPLSRAHYTLPNRQASPITPTTDEPSALFQETQLVSNFQNFSSVQDSPPQLKTWRYILNGSLGAAYSILDFPISYAGSAGIKTLFNWNGKFADEFVTCLGIFSSISSGIFIYKYLEDPIFWPKPILSKALAIASLFSSVTFFAAGREGTQLLGFNSSTANIVGAAIYLIRFLTSVDGCAKLPKQYKEIVIDLKLAKQKKDCKEILRIITAFFTILGISLSATDPIYASIKKLLGDINSNASFILCTTSVSIGTIGGFPMPFYWAYRGVKQITYGGKIGLDGYNPDPTDKFTFISMLFSLTLITASLGILSSPESQEGEVFAELGSWTAYVKFTSALLITVLFTVPSTSSFLRDFSNSLSKINSYIKNCLHRIPAENGIRRESIHNEDIPLIIIS